MQGLCPQEWWGQALAPWLAITSTTPRPVLPAALGSSHHGQMRTVTSTVPVCGQRQPSLGTGVGSSSAPTTQDTLFLVQFLKQGVPPTILSTAHSLLGHFGPALRGLAGAMELQSGMESSPS